MANLEQFLLFEYYLDPVSFLLEWAVFSRACCGYSGPIVVAISLSIFAWFGVLFQTIQFSISTQFQGQKHFYFKQFSLVKQF